VTYLSPLPTAFTLDMITKPKFSQKLLANSTTPHPHCIAPLIEVVFDRLRVRLETDRGDVLSVSTDCKRIVSGNRAQFNDFDVFPYAILKSRLPVPCEQMLPEARVFAGGSNRSPLTKSTICRVHPVCINRPVGIGGSPIAPMDKKQLTKTTTIRS